MIDKSSADVVYYDGNCNLCYKVVLLIKRFDQKKRLRFIPLQEADIDFGNSNQEFNTIIFKSKNKIFQKSDAVLQIVRNLKTPVSWFYMFVIIPKFIRDKLYDFVAKNRFNWFGRCDSCQSHI